LGCHKDQDYNDHFNSHCLYDPAGDTIPGVILLISRKCIVGAEIPEWMQAKIKEVNPSPATYYLLNFWFLECEPCIKEIPDLNALHALDPKIRVISFCRNWSADIKAHPATAAITYPIIPESEYVCDSIMRITWGYPTNLLVDKHFTILQNYGGLSNGSPDLKSLKEILVED
jgi:hypothetical protein